MIVFPTVTIPRITDLYSLMRWRNSTCHRSIWVDVRKLRLSRTVYRETNTVAQTIAMFNGYISAASKITLISVTPLMRRR